MNRYIFPLWFKSHCANDIINLNANLSFKLFSRSSHMKAKLNFNYLLLTICYKLLPLDHKLALCRSHVGSSQRLSLYKHSVRMLSTGASEKADEITDSVGIHTFIAPTDKNIRSPDRNIRLIFFCMLRKLFFPGKTLMPVLNELTYLPFILLGIFFFCFLLNA